MDIRQKNFTARVLPFKVTQGHWNWHGSIGDLRLVLVIRGNHGPISYHFGDKQRFQIPIFPTPNAFKAPADTVPLVTAGALKKTSKRLNV